MESHFSGEPQASKTMPIISTPARTQAAMKDVYCVGVKQSVHLWVHLTCASCISRLSVANIRRTKLQVYLQSPWVLWPAKKCCWCKIKIHHHLRLTQSFHSAYAPIASFSWQAQGSKGRAFISVWQLPVKRPQTRPPHRCSLRDLQTKANGDKVTSCTNNQPLLWREQRFMGDEIKISNSANGLNRTHGLRAKET